MSSPNNTTNITPPRVPLIDERTGLISREWYRFFLNLFTLTGSGTNQTSLVDLQLAPPTPQQEDIVEVVVDVQTTKIQPTQESATEQIAELQKQVEALAVMPLTSWVLSAITELQAQIDGLLATSIPPVNFLTNGSSILYGDNLGGFSNVTIGSGVSFSGGTLSATGSGGTVTAVTGVAPITSTGGTTPAIGVTAAALTEVDDTNVTLTLGGSPTTALLAATSLTLGWTGQLATGRGGTGLSSYIAGDLLYYASGTTLTRLGIGAANTVLISSGTAPQWSSNLAIGSLSATSISDSGNLTFTGTGNRIIGDMTNGTLANRLLFQTSTANSATVVGAIPSGTGTSSQLRLFNSSDPANSGGIRLLTTSGLIGLEGLTAGTGTQLDMDFSVGGSSRMRLFTTGGVSIGDTTDPGAGNLRLGTGNLVIGTSGKGIDFSATPGTGTSELFSDYEEGAFTPTAQGSTTAGTATYAYQQGYYTKVGRLVTFHLIIGWSSHTGTGNLRIYGLPFTSANLTNLYSNAYFGDMNGLALTANNYATSWNNANTAFLFIGQNPTGGGAGTLVPIDANVAYIQISGSYYT